MSAQSANSPSITLIVLHPAAASDRGDAEAARALIRLHELHPRVERLDVSAHRDDTFAACLRAAASRATGDLIALFPATGDYLADDLVRAIAVLTRNDLDAILGVRVIRRDPVLRRFRSTALNVIQHAILSDRFRDPDCLVRVFRREARAAMLADADDTLRFAGLFAAKAGLRIAEVEVRQLAPEEAPADDTSPIALAHRLALDTARALPETVVVAPRLAFAYLRCIALIRDTTSGPRTRDLAPEILRTPRDTP